ncbi:hypothetical protein L226DRAFT_545643 [Lentinus tigrinus ALCF2SS1-7]|uniref:uncharacterized protein n=1 Tax=Lentinus tigrinus ALCF2SS1-7 TaxID=1328758 RepID=UPI00116638EA|nr:hypothetical protein L226DRAFT_545643 [Lentinus tigrinus ALCF2SS1-7]
MPGRRVHFADETAPPSESRSGSTHPTPTGHTPRRPRRPMRAGVAVSLPGPYLGTPPAQIILHPLLAATNGDAPLDWDMSLPAEASRVHLARYPPQLVDTVVCQPATNPAMQCVTIICTHLPWTITVTPTPSATWTAPYVTVGDVLHTLYHTLHLGVTSAELGVLDAPRQRRVTATYIGRYRRVVDPCKRDWEKAKRIKRIDFLCDRRAFLGILLVEGGIPSRGLPHGAVWLLHTLAA